MNVSQLRAGLNKHLAEKAHAARQVKEETGLLETARGAVSSSLQAQQALQEVAESVQSLAHGKIADVVTRCLQAVFLEDYVFQIRFERKRGKTEARLLFLKDGKEEDPVSASGGGVLDVAAFALRVASLCLSQPKKRKLIVLDEPLRFLSVNHLPRAASMIQALAEELEIQFIVVTHSPALEIGKVVEIG